MVVAHIKTDNSELPGQEDATALDQHAWFANNYECGVTGESGGKSTNHNCKLLLQTL